MTRLLKLSSTPTFEDLLRAMLMFAGAGLDRLSKQLVEDALPRVIQLHEGARENLRAFIERRLSDERSASRLLGVALSGSNSQQEVIGQLVAELIAGSLQSAEELSRVAAYFDIPTTDIISDYDHLSAIFRARNEIAHELDVDFTQEDRHRRRRERDLMVGYVNELFGIAKRFLMEVEARV